MENIQLNSDLRSVVAIVTPVLAEIVKQIFKDNGTEVRYEIDGEGTASREWMDVLGLANAEKKILVGMMPKAEADAMSEKLGRSLPLKKAGNGIVFTLPAEKMKTSVGKLPGVETGEVDFCLVVIIANKGTSEKVMDAARTVGASGGTVVHGEEVRKHALIKAWGLRHAETREIILILSQPDKAKVLMSAVMEQCGSDPQVQARTFVNKVEQAEGLHYYLQ